MGKIETNFTAEQLQGSCHSLHDNRFPNTEDKLFWIDTLKKYKLKFFAVSPAELLVQCGCNSKIHIHLEAINNPRWFCNSCKCHLKYGETLLDLLFMFNEADLTRSFIENDLKIKKTKKTKKTKPVKSKPVPKNNNIFSIFEEPK